MTSLTRRHVLGGTAALGAAGLGVHLLQREANGSRGVDQTAATPRARRDLNLLILMVDQERSWDTLPPRLDIPHHRSLADRGTSFTAMNVTAPLCTPSRSVFWTGQHVQHTHVQDNTNVPLIGRPLDPAIPTLGHMLRDAGFYTAYKGKWHLHGLPKDEAWGASPKRSRALEAYGYADYGWGPEYIDSQAGWKYDGRIADDAASWLTSTGPRLEQPWALTVSFVNPHDIMYFDATGEQATTRIQDVFPGPVLGSPDDPLYDRLTNAEVPRNFESATRPRNVTAHTDYDRYMADFYGHMPYENVEAWVRFSQYYHNCIRDVDRHLGTVLEALEASGQADTTIVVLVSDHGEMGGVHGLRQKGPWIYRENLNVPFVISHPDARTPRTNTGIASALDFTPTMLGLVGMDGGAVQERYTAMRGLDLSGDVTTTSTERSRADTGALVTYSVGHHVDTEYARGVLQRRDPSAKTSSTGEDRTLLPDLSARGFMRGIVTDRFKFARYFSPRDHHRPETLDELQSRNDLELFDLIGDPGETTNIAAADDLDTDTLLRLNGKLNTLIESEVGPDDGRDMPGPAFFWRG
ncbi:MAG: sulfatase-like hydrolase/transferase [Pseudomonadota bacterium]